MSNLIQCSQLVEAGLTMFLEDNSLTYLQLIKKLAKQNLGIFIVVIFNILHRKWCEARPRLCVQ